MKIHHFISKCMDLFSFIFRAGWRKLGPKIKFRKFHNQKAKKHESRKSPIPYKLVYKIKLLIEDIKKNLLIDLLILTQTNWLIKIYYSCQYSMFGNSKHNFTINSGENKYFVIVPTSLVHQFKIYLFLFLVSITNNA